VYQNVGKLFFCYFSYHKKKSFFVYQNPEKLKFWLSFSNRLCNTLQTFFFLGNARPHQATMKMECLRGGEGCGAAGGVVGAWGDPH
jgi:hypothetical protein